MDMNLFIDRVLEPAKAAGIDTAEVVAGMNTKWNALGFRPGLVGGHCIGVDPYYFTYEAEKLGYHSQIILNGRKVNGEYVFEGAQVAIDMQDCVEYQSMCPQCYFVEREKFYKKREKV